MMNEYTHCSHGKKYVGEDCPECEAVWFTIVQLPELVRGCKRAAAFAHDHPGLVERDAAHAIASLNATVAKLADLLLAASTRSDKNG